MPKSPGDFANSPKDYSRLAGNYLIVLGVVSLLSLNLAGLLLIWIGPEVRERHEGFRKATVWVLGLGSWPDRRIGSAGMGYVQWDRGGHRHDPLLADTGTATVARLHDRSPGAHSLRLARLLVTPGQVWRGASL
jgi:hypothetical protein